MTNKNVLYRVYDASDALLYVGATTNFAQRLTAHASYQPWWDRATRVELKHYGSFEAMAEAEVEAIRVEQPEYNVIYAWPLSRERKPRRQKGEGSVFRRADGVWIGRVELPAGPNGKRRAKTVSSKDRQTVIRRLGEIKADASCG